MKKQIKNIGITVVTLVATLFAAKGFSQACEGNQVTVSIANMVSNPKTSTIEFDVTIANTGKNNIKLASLSGALIHTMGFASSGIFSVVNQPSNADFPNFNNIIATDYAVGSRQLRWTNNPVKEGNAITLPAGVVKKFARFRFKRTSGNGVFEPNLKFQEFVQKGFTAINAIVYCNGNVTYTALANRKMTDSKEILIVAKNGVTNNPLPNGFNVNASPNPFTDTFKIDIQSNTGSDIEIKVYDMLGKLIESKSVEKSALEDLTIGSNYPSGIYNVTVSQDENLQTLRMIRR